MGAIRKIINVYNKIILKKNRVSYPNPFTRKCTNKPIFSPFVFLLYISTKPSLPVFRLPISPDIHLRGTCFYPASAGFCLAGIGAYVLSASGQTRIARKLGINITYNENAFNRIAWRIVFFCWIRIIFNRFEVFY